MNTKLVNTAVKIKLSLLTNHHGVAQVAKLQKDLRRILDSMTGEERNEYTKRVS